MRFPPALTAAASLAMLFLPGCFPRPLDLQLSNAQDCAPVEGVTIHRHSVTLLSLLATDSNAVKSGPAGEARVWVPPFNTKLTLLQPGFEPSSIEVFSSKTTPSMLTAEDSSRMVLRFDDLDGKAKRSMSLTPVTYLPMTIRVVDSSDKAPIVDADVLATTFLYLPMPGLEDRWGFPDLQNLRTDDQGHSSVNHASGFRNVITVRKPGYQEARQDFEANGSKNELIVSLRRLQYKTLRFKAVDAESEKQVPGVVIRLDEQRNGLPPDPNGFAAVSDASGLSPAIPVPNLMPLVIETECPGYRRYSAGLDWRSLKEGEVVKVQVRKKGWFE
ncbi:MAG: hypothetical protein K8R92_07590 [Planctomycetes bacterium]|nr:hypothetical protein [Planctomycetota bacterium]